MARLAPGTQLGPYEIVAPLGSGGMGEVFRARDPRLGREVALKVLPEAVAGRADRLARFEREAKTVAALNHPHIVTIHSIEEAGGTRFLTMELIDGESLDRVIPNEGLPLLRMLELAGALADALAAAHAKGIVHRDLKPSNVMVTSEGRLKVLDFGLAKLEPAQAASPETPAPTQALTVEAPVSSAGQIVGTAPYMSPEQLRGEAADARADVFALGIILYEMASGHRPFAGQTFADLSSAILRDQPVPLRGQRADLPETLDALVSTCLEKDRDRRKRSAASVRDAIDSMRREIESKSSSRVETQAAARTSASIAVLPFTNLSADPDNEFFSDGLSEELLNVLVRNPGLQVTGRTSSFAFKGKHEDMREIGHKLGVAHLLEGSVRRAGNRVRITAQLVKAADGFHLWSETYDRVLDDIFAVQDDIASAVSEALDVALLGRRPEPKRAAENFELLLRANHFRQQHSRDSFERAEALYKEALDNAPDDAQAWAGLASTYVAKTAHGFAESGQGVQQSIEAAEKAISLDSQVPAAYETLGWIRAAFQFRWPEAFAAFRKAREIAPSDGSVLIATANVEAMHGRFEEALKLGERALALDPLSASTHLFFGRMLIWCRDYPRAYDAYSRALELSPGIATGHAGRANVMVHLGRIDESITEAGLEESAGYRNWALAVTHGAAGHEDKAQQALDALVAGGDQWAFQIATIRALRGEPDEAFRWLERGFELGDPGMPAAPVAPWLESLHDDPRWPAFIERLGLKAV